MTFATIYREHAAFVWRFVRRLGVRESDVEDVCQEVFVVLHRRFADYDGSSSMRTFIVGIAMRTASDYRRRAHRRHETGEPVPDTAVPATQGDDLDRQRARALLDRALDELDDEKRAVFVLFELEETPMTDVAVLVGAPLQTVYSRLAAARKQVEAYVRRTQLTLLSGAGTS